MRIAFWTSAGDKPRRSRASRRLGPIWNTSQFSPKAGSGGRPRRGTGWRRATIRLPRGRSSAGRASGWQPEGQGFEPPRLHCSGRPPCRSRHGAPWAPPYTRRVSQDTVELLFRGYRAFVDGDLDAIGTMLDPDVEWVAAGEDAIVVSRDRVLEVLAERVDEDYHVVVDRAVGLPDRVV